MYVTPVDLPTNVPLEYVVGFFIFFEEGLGGDEGHVFYQIWVDI